MDALSGRVQDALGARYRVEGVTATGGMCTILRATDLKHDRIVAVKVLHDEVSGQVGSDRFLREIRLIARLQHPHIVPLFDSGTADGLLYYTMPFVEGETLRKRLQREGRLPVAVALAIAREVCDALGYAHAHGTLHRDVKPENILLADGHALLGDFGVARMLYTAAPLHTTGTGLVLGTPAYMSPEQASGERELDARSDLYSLGCVLYEMLAGVAPYSAPNARALLAERFRSLPKPLRAMRGEVPPRVERAVERVLALLPEQRFASAAALAAELVDAQAHVTVPARRGTGHLRLALGAAVIVLLPALWGRVHQPAEAAVDASTVVVFPLAGAPTTSGFLTGDHCARLIYDAIGRWTGISLVDAMRVRDLFSRGEQAPRSLADVRRQARELGAGLAVWGELYEANGDVEVRATLYRVARDIRPVHRAQVRIAEAHGPDSAFMQLADALLGGSVPGASAVTGAVGTRDVQALRLYVGAQEALDTWNLAAAESLFREATRADSGYARAYLGLAQVQSWREEAPVEDWRRSARLAASRSDRLGPIDRLHAEALQSLASFDRPGACARYREILLTDSLSFAAWFGLGECQSRDRLVLRDPTSRSGWRFRSSQQGAISAYLRAFELVPSFQRVLTGTAFDRLSRLLYAETNYVRMGFAVERDTMPFAAYPELDHDTLAFVPFPRDSVYAAATGTDPATHRAAVGRNRRLLRDLAGAWVDASNRDPAAHEALALALELTGPLTDDGVQQEGGSALGALDRALALARTRAMKVRLAATRVRLLVKSGRLEQGAALADSLLKTPPATARDALLLAGVAALVGRTGTAARWARQGASLLATDPASGELRVPVAPAREALALLVFAANGLDADSVRLLANRVERLIESAAPQASRAPLRRELLDWSATLAYPLVGPSPLLRRDWGGNVHMGAEYALTQGDTARARAWLAHLDRLAEREHPGDAGIDAMALQMELSQLVGDTSSAVSIADRTFHALPESGRQLVDRLPESAALPRLLLRRAEIALRRGAGDEAQPWIQRFVLLTPNAEGATLAARRRLLSVAVPR